MDKMIRFINSRYEDVFKLPDGGVVEVTFPDRKFSMKCEYMDEYHMRLGSDVFHICQFAEMLERGGGSCQIEPVVTTEQAAWDIGCKGFLAIQTCDDGYDYTIYDKDLNEIDGGQLDEPEESMGAIRNEILADIGWDKKSMTVIDYDELMEAVDAKVCSELPEKRASILKTLSGLEGIGTDPTHKGKTEVER